MMAHDHNPNKGHYFFHHLVLASASRFSLTLNPYANRTAKISFRKD